mmetsp:Transcript_6636/g.10664  ORF Transcript_6636/g.10664 Transcript_6636/m.10664 type:complete len:562 (+) Transcript_6636:53-1738(+)
MTSRTKPWELPHDAVDPQVPPEVEANEKDPLIAGKPIRDAESLREFIDNLADAFGYKMLLLLFATQFLLKGFTVELIRAAEPYIYKLYHVPADTMQIFQGVTSIPWVAKPIIGLVSDVLPINGYNKAPYMFIWSVLGIAAFATIATFHEDTLPILGLVIALFVIQMQTSTSDLLSEAKYAERMRGNPRHGPGLLTYVWFGMYVGSLAAVLCSGFVISRYGPYTVYFIGMFTAASVLYPVAMNYMEETQLSDEKIAKVRSHFWSQPELCFLCCLMLAVSVSLTILGLNYGPEVTSIAAVISGLATLIAFGLVLTPVIAKFVMFSVLQSSLALSVSGATFYFYTDTVEQFPEGPHFTPFFFNSVIGALSSIFSLLGIFLYQRYTSTWKYRHIFLVMNALFSLACLTDILMFTRANVKIGIPDHIMIIGGTIFENVFNTMLWMPQVVILSFMCPKGMEATMYALLAGSHNLGSTISSNCGAFLLRKLSCTPSGLVGESAAFENLWVAAVIATVLPMITISALFWLLPDARQNENIPGVPEDDVCCGSLWRRWTGAETSTDVDVY